MKKTISEKAQKAIAELNAATLTLLSQIQSENIDKSAADKIILSAQRKAKTLQRAYFFRGFDLDHPKQMEEFHRSELFEEVKKAHAGFGDVLGIFANKVGCSFIDASDSILNVDLIG